MGALAELNKLRSISSTSNKAGIRKIAKSSGNDPYAQITAYKGAKNASKYSDEEWRDFAKQTGFPGGSNVEFQRYLLNHPKYGPLVQQLHKEIGPNKAGRPDEGYLGARYDVIKDTLTGQQSPQLTGKPYVTTPLKTGEASNLNTGYQFEPARSGSVPQWWLQDVIKTAGAAGDFLRLKKYLPWAPKVNPVIPEPTFYDPTRELAANTEQMNIGTQGAGVFSGPQEYNARFSQIQGQGAKNVADILGKYNNLNVGVANQYSGIKGDIINKANAANASIATDLYDKTTIANQNYDNAKAQARQELRQSFIDAITNRAKTQVLNSVYPHYQIDPTTGGTMPFVKGSRLSGAKQAEYPMLNAYLEAVRENPDIDPNKLAPFFGVKETTGNRYVPPGYGE